MRLSNETNTLTDVLSDTMKRYNLTFKLKVTSNRISLQIADNGNIDCPITYDIIIKNKDIKNVKLKEVAKMDVSNFEIEVLSPIDYLAENEINELWNIEHEFDEFIENRFFQ